MVSIFYWILNMTILGSILAFMLMGLRRIKKLPRIFVYAMYSLVFLRLICPLGLTNGLSLLNLLPEGSVKLVYLEGKELAASTTELSYTNFIQDADSYQPFVLKSDRLTRFYEISSVVWITVGGALLLGYSIMYFMSMKELRKSIHIKDNIYRSDSVNVPMVVGIIKPRICDEKVMRNYDTRERAEYAAALLAFTQKEPVIYAASFGGGNIKLRIKRVLDYRSLSIIALLMFCCLFIAIAILTLSNK